MDRVRLRGLAEMVKVGVGGWGLHYAFKSPNKDRKIQGCVCVCVYVCVL